MRKITFILVGILLLSGFANAQTIIFKETFGITKTSRDGCTTVAVLGTAEAGKYDPQKNENYSAHDWNDSTHVWNVGVVYAQISAATATAGACDAAETTLNIRGNNPSTYTGASGNGNLYFNANQTNSFTIRGINAHNYTNISLSFGVYGKNKSDVTFLKVQCDTGTGLADIATTQIAALSTTKATWLTVTGVTLPTSDSLLLKFSTPNLNGTAPIEIRIDDVKVTGTQSLLGVNTSNVDNRKLYVTSSGLSFNGFTDETVQIFNTGGMRVYSAPVKDLIQPNLPTGLYIVKAGNFTQKITLEAF